MNLDSGGDVESQDREMHDSTARTEASSSTAAGPDQQSNPTEVPGRQVPPGQEFKEERDAERAGEKEHTPSMLERVERQGAVLGLLAFSSIWGSLAREGLIALNTYDGMSIEPTVWAQTVACLIMGWTVANRKALEDWYAPSYILLGTGFCGSLSTFSSWMLKVFQAFGDQKHYNRHGLHNVMDAITQTGSTIGMSLISLYAGFALADFLPLRPLLVKLGVRGRPAPDGKGQIYNTRHPRTLDWISIALGLLFWAGAGILCGTYPPFRQVTFAIVLSPPGAFLRWYLARFNAPTLKKPPYWPIGTMGANLLSTAIICAVFVGQRVGRIPGAGGGGARTIIGCHALYGVQEGFCGCLSTISTFAVELNDIKPRRRAVGYAVASWVFAILICILIIGAPWWSIGLDGSCVGITL